MRRFARRMPFTSSTRTAMREFYDLTRRNPYELDNTYADLGPGTQARLHDTLTKLEGCSGQDCWVTAGG